MQKYKLTKTSTKEVVASLNIEGFSLKRNLDKINAWIKDMSQGHCSLKIVPVTNKGAYRCIFSSDNQDWEAYRSLDIYYTDEIFVAHTTHEVSIVPETSEILEELKKKLNEV